MLDGMARLILEPTQKHFQSFTHYQLYFSPLPLLPSHSRCFPTVSYAKLFNPINAVASLVMPLLPSNP